MIKSLKTEFNLFLIERSGTYGAVNTLRLDYNKTVVILCMVNFSLCCGKHTKHINANCGENVEFLILNPEVTVTTGPYRVNMVSSVLWLHKT